MKTYMNWMSLAATPLAALALTVFAAAGSAQAQSASASGVIVPATTAASAASAAPTSAAATVATAAPAAVPAGDAQIMRGAYLSKVGDCAACHTVDKSKPFAGGLPLATPFGTLYSTNITPDNATGIGAYSYDDFARALREGVAKDGRRLYPAMPYPSYAKINDDDMHALYRYFLSGVQPISAANHENGLNFPFNIRPLMTVWNTLYLPKGIYQPDPQQSVEWNRGAYLVEGLEHCGACHTPRGVTGQELSFGEQGNGVFLSGYTLAGWYAPNLRSVVADHGGNWSHQDVVAYLRSGRSKDGAAFGPMSEVIEDSTQYLHDDDLNAIATYLGSPAVQNVVSTVTQPTPAAAGTQDVVATELRAGHIGSTGAAVYLNSCNACHRSDGTGAMAAFPALAGNAAVNTTDPSSLIHIVLTGSHMPATDAAPTPVAMPGFGARLSDQQVADLLSFVRSSWGNHAPAVTSDQVAKVRKVVSSTP